MSDRSRVLYLILVTTAGLLAAGGLVLYLFYEARVGIILGGTGFLFLLLGSMLFLRVTNPMIARLQESEERMRGIVETAVDSIITIDSTGTIRSVNPATEKLFGHRAGELVGRNVSVLMPSPYREEHDGYLRRYLETGERKIIGIGREVAGLRRDGSTFPMYLAVSEIRVGRERLFTGIVRDITERVAAEHALKAERDRAQRYLDIAAVIMLALDASGRVTLINRKGLELLGRDEDEVIGKEWFQFLPRRTRNDLRRVFREIMAGLAQHRFHENPILSKDGREIIVAWHNTLVRDAEGNVVGSLSSGVDITEQKRAKERLIEQASLARLGEMATIVAHEVRNPLAGIAGAARVLKGRLPSDSTEAGILEEMIERVMSLNRTVNDILVFSRPRKPDLHPVPVGLLLEDSVALLKEDPQFSEAEFHVSAADATVPCDVEMMKPVFLNLLVNAAQSLGGPGRVTVSTRMTDGCCEVSFRDTGPGIPADVRESIFEPFFTTKKAGTGLGLPIARRVVDQHGGSISVDCPADGGTLVVVRLPASPAPAGREG